MGTTRSRADAQRNYERVVAAATAVLADKGPAAGVEEIAARAGVGRGTLYRCFPTKDHLVAAVACERLAWMERLADAAAGREDAWTAFVELLVEVSEAQASNALLAAGMESVMNLPEVERARSASNAALDRLMDRAKAQGAMRSDATSRDVRVLFAGVARALSPDEQHDPAVWRRYATLIAAALRAEGSQP